MADQPPRPTVEIRLHEFLAAELRQAELDFPRLPRSERPPVRRPLSIGTLGAAVAILSLVALGYVYVQGRSGGAGGTSVGPTASVSITSAAPSPTPSAPQGSASSTPAETSLADGVDCMRIPPAACAEAIALARAGHKNEVSSATLIVVDDTCPPDSLCDRRYPFDSIVVFVTAGGDTTGWYAFHVFGRSDGVPTTAEPWTPEFPAHVVQRIRELLP
jgi:hypothetical protein